MAAPERRQADGSAPAAADTVLNGLRGSPGSYTGPSRMVTGLDQAGRVEPGDVLVAPFTDAAWTPLFLVAGAVVVDLGAINSDAMVLARALGIPCGYRAGRRLRIPDGALVTVDGTAGPSPSWRSRERQARCRHLRLPCWSLRYHKPSDDRANASMERSATSM